MAGFFHWREDDLLLQVRVQPRSSRDEVVGPLGDRLKIRITAPPIDGRANIHLVKYLSGQFKTPVGRISVLSGQSARNKQLLISRPTLIPDWLK